MKIWINTLTPEKLSAINEAEIKAGIKTLTSEPIVIKGETFLRGEWRHLPDDFVIDPKLYPYIQDPETVLQERISQVMKENGLDAFAQGIRDAAVLYEKAEPVVSLDVKKYADVVPVDCVAVLTAVEKPIEEKP